MTLKRAILAATFSVVFVLLTAQPGSSEIYYFVDASGVWHFTNLKIDHRYRPYGLRSRTHRPRLLRDYEKIILQASRQYGVCPALIKSVIKAESDFDHLAISHKGAQGLMQLMPQTADEMEVLDPFNPEENIVGGTRYLSLMLKRFKNNLKLALAAYNAGPTVVEAYQGLPPYPETKQYVTRVLEYYQAFSHRPQ